MPLSAQPDDLDTLRQLDDTARLAYRPLSREACHRLQCAGLVIEDDGWWRITALGRRMLKASALGLPGGNPLR